MYEYGKHLGLAFQVVDDILDFTQTEAQLGKPQGQDLATGNLTAPIALRAAPGRRRRASRAAGVRTRFEAEGDLEQRHRRSSTRVGIEDARTLAREEADMALAVAQGAPGGRGEGDRWWTMVQYVLERIY